ncbi:MAG: hypothetical protein PSW75_02440, partial [bacterium]|nr:hypothetical protein [bacterium]
TRLRVEAALADYIGSYPASPDAGFLGPRLRKISVWNPVAGRGRTFAEYLRISPAVTNKPADQLGRALFEIDQLYGELDVGFRGAPSLGTLVLADAFNSLRSAVPPDTVWSTLENALNLDNAAGRETKVVLVGSLFGGMGAAGLPAVAKFLREKYPVSQFPKLHIALGTVLPHFTFPSDRIEGPHARHEDFIATSKNTLLHYIRHNLDKQVNAVYVFGHDAAVQMPNCALGRGEQKNPAHFIDLYAGLATLHFWQEWKPAPVGTPQTIFQRANRDLVDGQGANTIRWNQLPWQDPINDPKRMTQMTNFCLALIQSFGPRLLQFTKDRSFPATEAPWIMDYFGGDPARIRAEEGKIEHLRSYAKHYLLWLAQVQ